MIYALCFVLIAIGIYGAVVKKNVVKIVISLAIVEYAINLLLILIAYRMDGWAPVVTKAMTGDEDIPTLLLALG